MSFDPSYTDATSRVNFYKNRNSSTVNPQVGKHLMKTKICSLYLNGRCHYGSERCFFAHSVDELREQPRLMKTSLCPDFKRGRCMKGDCKYAHSHEEMAAAAKQVACLWYKNGHCSHGTSCRYSHDGLEDVIDRKTSTLSSAAYSPSTTPTTHSSPITEGGIGTSSFDEFEVSPSTSIFDLFNTPSVTTPPEVRYDDPQPVEPLYCSRCGSSIGCICKVFDECPDLLRLI